MCTGVFQPSCASCLISVCAACVCGAHVVALEEKAAQRCAANKRVEGEDGEGDHLPPHGCSVIQQLKVPSSG